MRQHSGAIVNCDHLCVAMSSENGYHDDSSDDSDRESDGAQQRYEDILSGSEFDENENGQNGRWAYLRCNARGGEAYKGFPQRNLSENAFKLDYNGVDSMLIDEATAEREQSLNKVRVKLFKTDKNQSISPAQALTSVLTFGWIVAFHNYLKAGLSGKFKSKCCLAFICDELVSNHITYGRHVEADLDVQRYNIFFRCNLRMRYHNCSAEMLGQSLLKVPQSEQTGFRVVRNALTAADVPASARKVTAGAQAPAFSFDPLIQEGISSLNKEWTGLYFVHFTRHKCPFLRVANSII